MALALFLAVMLNSKIPLRGFIRSAVYAPAVVSTVVVGTVFTWIFQDQLGLINYLLTSVGAKAIQWNNDPKFAMLMLVTATMWQKAGYNMVIYLAGLQGIPTELIEAATIDGSKYIPEIQVYNTSAVKEHSYVRYGRMYDRCLPFFRLSIHYDIGRTVKCYQNHCYVCLRTGI